MGAGLVARGARRVAWTAGTAAGLTVGLIGMVVAIKAGTLGLAVHQAIPG